ncbi:hypothetical protein HDV05_005711 [Chytridiales sp. JEL 0842]|nr:hypothetical protein HDV05_005711 [Chytridiales sp. JEL 0842]
MDPSRFHALLDVAYPESLLTLTFTEMVGGYRRIDLLGLEFQPTRWDEVVTNIRLDYERTRTALLQSLDLVARQHPAILVSGGCPDPLQPSQTKPWLELVSDLLPTKSQEKEKGEWLTDRERVVRKKVFVLLTMPADESLEVVLMKSIPVHIHGYDSPNSWKVDRLTFTIFAKGPKSKSPTSYVITLTSPSDLFLSFTSVEITPTVFRDLTRSLDLRSVGQTSAATGSLESVFGKTGKGESGRTVREMKLGFHPEEGVVGGLVGVLGGDLFKGCVEQPERYAAVFKVRGSVKKEEVKKEAVVDGRVKYVAPVLRKAKLVFLERVLYRTREVMKVRFEEMPKEHVKGEVQERYAKLKREIDWTQLRLDTLYDSVRRKNPALLAALGAIPKPASYTSTPQSTKPMSAPPKSNSAQDITVPILQPATPDTATTPHSPVPKRGPRKPTIVQTESVVHAHHTQTGGGGNLESLWTQYQKKAGDLRKGRDLDGTVDPPLVSDENKEGGKETLDTPLTFPQYQSVTEHHPPRPLSQHPHDPPQHGEPTTDRPKSPYRPHSPSRIPIQPFQKSKKQMESDEKLLVVYDMHGRRRELKGAEKWTYLKQQEKEREERDKSPKRGIGKEIRSSLSLTTAPTKPKKMSAGSMLRPHVYTTLQPVAKKKALDRERIEQKKTRLKKPMDAPVGSHGHSMQQRVVGSGWNQDPLLTDPNVLAERNGNENVERLNETEGGKKKGEFGWVGDACRPWMKSSDRKENAKGYREFKSGIRPWPVVKDLDEILKGLYTNGISQSHHPTTSSDFTIGQDASYSYIFQVLFTRYTTGPSNSSICKHHNKELVETQKTCITTATTNYTPTLQPVINHEIFQMSSSEQETGCFPLTESTVCQGLDGHFVQPPPRNTGSFKDLKSFDSYLESLFANGFDKLMGKGYGCSGFRTERDLRFLRSIACYYMSKDSCPGPAGNLTAPEREGDGVLCPAACLGFLQGFQKALEDERLCNPPSTFAMLEQRKALFGNHEQVLNLTNPTNNNQLSPPPPPPLISFCMQKLNPTLHLLQTDNAKEYISSLTSNPPAETENVTRCAWALPNDLQSLGFSKPLDTYLYCSQPRSEYLYGIDANLCSKFTDGFAKAVVAGLGPLNHMTWGVSLMLVVGMLCACGLFWWNVRTYAWSLKSTQVGTPWEGVQDRKMGNDLKRKEKVEVGRHKEDDREEARKTLPRFAEKFQEEIRRQSSDSAFFNNTLKRSLPRRRCTFYIYGHSWFCSSFTKCCTSNAYTYLGKIHVKKSLSWTPASGTIYTYDAHIGLRHVYNPAPATETAFTRPAWSRDYDTYIGHYHLQ